MSRLKEPTWKKGWLYLVLHKDYITQYTNGIRPIGTIFVKAKDIQTIEPVIIRHVVDGVDFGDLEISHITTVHTSMRVMHPCHEILYAIEQAEK